MFKPGDAVQSTDGRWKFMVIDTRANGSEVAVSLSMLHENPHEEPLGSSPYSKRWIPAELLKRRVIPKDKEQTMAPTRKPKPTAPATKKHRFGEAWRSPGGFSLALAGVRRAGIDFGYLRPDIEDSKPVVVALSRFLGVKPTEKQKDAAIDGFLEGSEARRQGKPNPNDAARAKFAPKPKELPPHEHPKATRKRHAGEAQGLKNGHSAELAKIRKRHREELAKLRKRQAREIASAQPRKRKP